MKDEDSKVPDHEKVEPNEKTQQSSAVSNKRGGRVSVNLIFDYDFGTGEDKVQDGGVHWGVCLERLHCDL